ncbi:hypothetical protein Tco_0077788 [Tanacetum coccineum]
MDGKTKNVLWEFWIKGGDEEVLLDDIVSSDGEWKEYDNTNHLNHNSNPFFKPYFDAQEVNNVCTFKKRRGCFDKRKPKIYGHDDIRLNETSVSDDKKNELLDEGV